METPQGPSVLNTCAVIVTYFPDDGIISRLRLIQKQIPSIIIVDNASSNSSRSQLQSFAESATVELLENTENEGIGKALNQAASLAIESGYLWMLTLDQDTLVYDDMFETLAAIYFSSDSHSPLIGSNYWDVSRKRAFVKCDGQSGRESIERRTVIASGTLTRLDLFTSIGGFREDYFIDSVDHEYCLRTRANGFQVVMSCKQLMSHSIGRQGSSKNLLLAFDHPPIRKYYIARNVLVTLKCYFWREPTWALCQLIRLIVEFMSIALLERDKRNKGHAFFRGIVDATRNKMGRREWS